MTSPGQSGFEATIPAAVRRALLDLRRLNSELLADVAVLQAQIGTWQGWTPVLTAATTDPNLGADGTVGGRYINHNGLIVARSRVAFSGTGVTGGSGFWSIEPPVPNATGIIGSSHGGTIATGVIRDASNGAEWPIRVKNDATIVLTNGTNPEQVDGTNPITISASDLMALDWSYEAA